MFTNTPDHPKAGEVFEVNKDGKLFFEKTGYYWLHYNPKQYPEWFQEVDGRWKPLIGSDYFIIDYTKKDCVGVRKWVGDSIDKAIQATEERVRGEVLESLKNTKDKKFPIGERKWCIECSERIYKEVKQ